MKHKTLALAFPFRADGPTRADLWRQIFRDHFDRWCDLRLEDEASADQRAYGRRPGAMVAWPF